MSPSILITGASGYLGGTLLSHLSRTPLPPQSTLYALVRSDSQASRVQAYGCTPLFLDLDDEAAVVKAITDANISIIFFLIDALHSGVQLPLIKALGEVRRKNGGNVHFLHTSGAKIFSGHAGMPVDRDVNDTDEGLYEMQKEANAPHEIMKTAVATNTTIIDTCESYGVRSYIFIPCIVYGEGEGFGNRISIQTVAVVRAAKALGAVYDVNPEGASWPVCHVRDNTAVYVKLLESILRGEDVGYGKNGYYLASSGSAAWRDIYVAIAEALAKRGVVGSSEVRRVDDATLEKMGKALECPRELVPVQTGGTCTLVPKRANELGWKAEYLSEHIFEAADAEVELILKHLKD